MSNWSKNTIDFGPRKLNETGFETIQYLGNQIISASNMFTSCGCTQPTYNSQTKVLTVGLHMNQIGTKTASITINYPDKTQDIIILKAEITQ